MFFDLHARGLLDGHDVTLSDNNADLHRLLPGGARLPRAGHRGALAPCERARPRRARHYYEIRNERFNPQRAALAAAPDRGFEYTASLAAMFIYLNRTGYNGLFRLNSDGEFNVPAGSYAKPKICDEPNVRRVARALARPGLTLERARFERMVERADAGDFLYFDPPYAPLSKTARFTSYTAEGFDADDQKRLRDLVVSLAHRGCHVLMSNSTAPEIAGVVRGEQRGEGGWAEVLQNPRAPRDQLERRAARRCRGVRHHEYRVNGTLPPGSSRHSWGSVLRQRPVQENDESAGRLDGAVDQELLPVVRVVVIAEQTASHRQTHRKCAGTRAEQPRGQWHPRRPT